MRHLHQHLHNHPQHDPEDNRPGGAFRGRGPGGGPRSRNRGGPWRARRGDVRAAVLALLAEEPMHGYQMIQMLDERTDGVWKPSPGSIYPALALLEDEGLIRADRTSGKRHFTLTDDGRAAVEADTRPMSPWDEVTASQRPGSHQLPKAIKPLVVALSQVTEAGTDEQITRAFEIVTDARRRIYAILAEDTTTTAS